MLINVANLNPNTNHTNPNPILPTSPHTFSPALVSRILIYRHFGPKTSHMKK